MSVERYEHHGKEVSVVSEVRGQHRQHCLCFLDCKNFKPGQADNCAIAQKLYENAVEHNLVTPVYECPNYNQN